MSISEREQQALAFIERDLADTGPELAAKLVIFARLAAGEEMPPRETVRLPARASAARPPASPPPLRLGSDRPRRPRGLRRRTALWLLTLVLTIVFLTLAVTFSRGGGRAFAQLPRPPHASTRLRQANQARAMVRDGGPSA